MKVSTYIASFLKSKGIHTVFELQGGMITRIIDALHHEGGINIVSMHHEQAAAMAVDSFGSYYKQTRYSTSYERTRGNKLVNRNRELLL